jgi:ABC-type amino acid transport system permease subunit
VRYNWDWGIFTQMAADGSGTWLHYLLVGLLWTLATALAAWVLALSIGSGSRHAAHAAHPLGGSPRQRVR